MGSFGCRCNDGFHGNGHLCAGNSATYLVPALPRIRSLTVKILIYLTVRKQEICVHKFERTFLKFKF